MKMNKLLLSFAFLFGLTLAGCKDPYNPHQHEIDENDLKVESVSFDVTEKSVEYNSNPFEINATVKFADDTPVDVDYIWNNSAPSIASMSVSEDLSKCFVTPIRAGKTYISLLVGLKTAICTVTVNGEEPGPEPGPGPGPGPEPEPGEFSLSLDVTGKSLVVGDTLQLTATGNVPEEGSAWSGEVSWVSSDESAATVSDAGLVTAIDEGSATITASTTYEEKAYTATCLISVETEDEDLTCDVYFFIDYNNLDEEDTTGTKLLAHFKWYGDKPLSESLKVPSNPTTSMDPAFPYFIGWSDHAIIDSKNDLWDMEKDVIGNSNYFYLFGIWADVPAGSFIL